MDVLGSAKVSAGTTGLAGKGLGGVCGGLGGDDGFTDIVTFGA